MKRAFCVALCMTLLLAGASLSFALQVGDKAPLFEGLSTKGKIRLQDYRAKSHVVLAFYFADFTPTWTGEMQAFQKDLKKFEGLNAQVLGISGDSLETHKKFSDEYKLQFPLIADVSEQIRKLYAPGRMTYLIDKNGDIQLIQEGVPRNKDFLKAIKKLEQKPWG